MSKQVKHIDCKINSEWCVCDVTHRFLKSRGEGHSVAALAVAILAMPGSAPG